MDALASDPTMASITMQPLSSTLMAIIWKLY
jgi:hypothetical protein